MCILRYFPAMLVSSNGLEMAALAAFSALPEVKCFNPSFDVTDHELLTGIVTEKGICYPPFNESLAALFKDKK